MGVAPIFTSMPCTLSMRASFEMCWVIFLTDDELANLFINHRFRCRRIANYFTLIKSPDPINETLDDFHVVFNEHNSSILLPESP